MEIRELLRAIHGGPPKLEALVCEGLSDDEMLARPDGMNSVAWLVWHMARCEDVGVNVLARNVPQVLDGGWRERVGVEATHIGTESSAEELEQFHDGVDVPALREYRAAVTQGTREWLKQVDLASLDEDAECERRLAEHPEVLSERSRAWVSEWWGGRSRLFYMQWLASEHHYLHLGEAQVTRERLGVGLRFA